MSTSTRSITDIYGKKTVGSTSASSSSLTSQPYRFTPSNRVTTNRYNSSSPSPQGRGSSRAQERTASPSPSPVAPAVHPTENVWKRTTPPSFIIDKPSIRKKSVMGIQAGSLSEAVNTIREKLIERFSKELSPAKYSSDLAAMQLLQQRFTQHETEWQKSMDCMCFTVANLDKKFHSDKYYDFKEHVVADLLNCAISFFVIGPTTMIANITLAEQIEIYFSKLLVVFDTIAKLHLLIRTNQCDHRKNLKIVSNAISYISRKKSELRKEQAELDNSAEDDLVMEKECEIQEIKNNISNAEKEKAGMEASIEKIIQDVNKLQGDMLNEYRHVSNVLKFCYFKRPEYCVALDTEIFSSWACHFSYCFVMFKN